MRDGVAHILSHLCVNCGDCFRACPRLAVRCRTTPLEHMRRCRCPVAAPSPTRFGQFGYRTTPKQILLALERLGFQQVMDMGWLCEINSAAMEEVPAGLPQAAPGHQRQLPGGDPPHRRPPGLGPERGGRLLHRPLCCQDGGSQRPGVVLDHTLMWTA